MKQILILSLLILLTACTRKDAETASGGQEEDDVTMESSGEHLPKGKVDIVEVKKFKVTDSSSEESRSIRIEKLHWVTDDVLIANTGARIVKAINVKTGKDLWSKEFDKAIECICSGPEHTYVALDSSYPHEEAESIRRLDVQSGDDSTPNGIPQPFLPQALIWSNDLNALCVLKHEELWIYSSDLKSVKAKIPYASSLPFVSSDGNKVLLSQHGGSCNQIDLKAESVTHVYGPPNKGRDGMIAIDAPFLSNAFMASDGRLIRIVDNSWSTGRVHLHADPKSKAKVVDSKNGHAVADVHWSTGQLAISGTSTNLLLLSTDGAFLGEMKSAVPARAYTVAFSPSGAKLAVSSENGLVKVFSIIHNRKFRVE